MTSKQSAIILVSGGMDSCNHEMLRSLWRAAELKLTAEELPEWPKVNALGPWRASGVYLNHEASRSSSISQSPAHATQVNSTGFKTKKVTRLHLLGKSSGSRTTPSCAGPKVTEMRGG